MSVLERRSVTIRLYLEMRFEILNIRFPQQDFQRFQIPWPCHGDYLGRRLLLRMSFWLFFRLITSTSLLESASAWCNSDKSRPVSLRTLTKNFFTSPSCLKVCVRTMRLAGLAVLINVCTLTHRASLWPTDSEIANKIPLFKLRALIKGQFDGRYIL